MNLFRKKVKEWVYSFSTEDHYAEYNSNDQFNMGMRSQGASHHDVEAHAQSANDNILSMEDDIDLDSMDGTPSEGVSEVLLAWRHIDTWTSEYNPDLNATLSDPCTANDIKHAEEDLEVVLPKALKASYRIHDGQEDLESMTGTSGLIYGLQLMTLDEIVAMTQRWRSVADKLNKQATMSKHSSVGVSNGSSMGSTASIGSSSQQQREKPRNKFKLPYIPEQKSIPPETVLPLYAHAMWIPVLTDNAGNHIGIDLSPARLGKHGQVIMFGRDFDTKYVVAENWGDFLLSFANDLEAGNWLLVDDSDDYLAGEGELVFRDKKSNGPIQDYLEVLKKRSWNKYQEQLRTNQETMQSGEPTLTSTRTHKKTSSFELDDDFDHTTTTTEHNGNEFIESSVPETNSDIPQIVKKEELDETAEETKEESNELDVKTEEIAPESTQIIEETPETKEEEVSEQPEEAVAEVTVDANIEEPEQQVEEQEVLLENEVTDSVNNADANTEAVPEVEEKKKIGRAHV